MKEKTFFEADEIKVTSARFIVDTEMYPISNISSIKRTKAHTTKAWAALCYTIAFLILLPGIPALFEETDTGLVIVIFGLFFLWAGKHLWKTLGTKYIVILNTSGNDVAALSSPNQEKIDNVIRALNEAIIYRG